MDDDPSTNCSGEKRQKTADVDRLTILPDEILARILSFFSTKEAIRICFLLPRRYHHLWTVVPDLQFDINEFLPDELKTLSIDEDELHEYEERFVNFVAHVLEHREPLTVDAFKLVWKKEDGNPTPATAWLETLALWKPKFLCVRILTEDYFFEFPDSVFTSELLEELVLNLDFDTINPRSVNLPRLKRLTLDTMIITDEAMQKLLSGLPALEEMVLEECQPYFSVISSGTLKCLVLGGICKNTMDPPEILISIPNLSFLEVRSWNMRKLKFEKPESLVEAQIHLEKPSDVKCLFLMGLSNVTSLEMVLSASCLKDMKDALAKETIKFPAFDNLKTLRIGGWCMTGDFELVDRFLLCAPNLKKLTLLHHKPMSDSNIEITFVLGNCLNIVGTSHPDDEKSASDQVIEIVRRHFKTIRGDNIIS